MKTVVEILNMSLCGHPLTARAVIGPFTSPDFWLLSLRPIFCLTFKLHLSGLFVWYWLNSLPACLLSSSVSYPFISISQTHFSNHFSFVSSRNTRDTERQFKDTWINSGFNQGFKGKSTLLLEDPVVPLSINKHMNWTVNKGWRQSKSIPHYWSFGASIAELLLLWTMSEAEYPTQRSHEPRPTHSYIPGSSMGNCSAFTTEMSIEVDWRTVFSSRVSRSWGPQCSSTIPTGRRWRRRHCFERRGGVKRTVG